MRSKSGNIELQIEEIPVSDRSSIVGMTLNECGIGRELDVIILAIKHKSGEMKFNPTFRSKIEAGDTLIAVGEASKLRILRDMAASKK